MFFLSLFLLEIILLFFLSQTLSRSFSHFLHKITKNRTVSIYLFAMLLLPGTIIHEISHFLMARLLFVYSGKMNLIPRLEGNTLKLGSVQVGKTDFFRNFLIGTAPCMFGIIILLCIMFAAMRFSLFENLWGIALVGYSVFVVGNTMYASKKDMEGSYKLFILLVLLLFIGYLLQIQIPDLSFVSHPFIQTMFQKASIYLALPIVIDVIIIAMLKSANTLS